MKNKKLTKSEKNYEKQVAFLINDYILSEYNDVKAIKEKIKVLLGGMDEAYYEKNDMDLYNEYCDEYDEFLDQFVNDYDYDFLSRHYTIFAEDYKNEFYKACMFANSNSGSPCDSYEWDRIMYGYRCLADEAIHRIYSDIREN